MKTRMTAAISIIAGLLIVAAIACGSSPASPAPTQTQTPTGQTGQPTPEPTAPPPPAPEPTAPPTADPASPTVGRVTGTVTYRERIALGPDAIVEVELLDVSRADAPSTTLGKVTIESPGQVPITFEIEYDPSKIDERFTYAVQARIMYGDKLAFINDTRYAVITRGSPTHVDMVLVKVGAAPSEPAPPSTATVTGTVTYRERIALGPDAIVEVELLDVSRADAPATALGKVTIVSPGQVPVSFEVEYDPSKIDERFTYAVRATITDRGRMAFTSTSAYNVITCGNPTHVDMVLQSVAAPRPTPPPGPEMVATPAPIETVEVAVTGSLDYSLLIVSGLPGGCVKFEGYELDRDGNLIKVTVTNLTPAAPVPCTAIYGRHEGELSVGGDFTPGETYRVVVSGEVTNSFVARDPEGPEMVLAESPIEKVEIVTLESFPPQYRLSVVSRLPLGSSCSKFNGYDVTRPFANTIHVKVTHLEVAEKNVPCTRDLPVVVTEIPLGIDFTSGDEYTVVVNNQVTETFKAQ